MYQKKVEEWQDLFMVLCHMIHGQPSRGTGLFSLKWKNTWNTARGFYILDGAVMTVTEYHKGQNRQQAPRVLARFLPVEVEDYWWGIWRCVIVPLLLAGCRRT